MDTSDPDPILLCPGCKKPIGGRVYHVETGLVVEWKLTDDDDPWSTTTEPNFLDSPGAESYWVCHDCGETIHDEDDFIETDGASR